MKPLTYLINCAPEGAPAEWHQSGEEFKDSEDVVAVIAYSEYQEQEKRIAELEAAVKANHEWHQEHDDYDGYQESELCTINSAALGASKTGAEDAK